MGVVERLAGQKVRIIGVDVNDGRSQARALLAKDHLAYPVGFDGSGVVSSDFRLVGLPTTVFLDGAHRVVGQVLGPLSVTVARSWFHRISSS
jgi:hypothetical protein